MDDTEYMTEEEARALISLEEKEADEENEKEFIEAGLTYYKLSK